MPDEVVYRGTLTGSDGSEWAIRDARLTLAPAPPNPPAPTPIVGTPNSALIGGSTYALSAVNPTRTDFPGGRGADQLVAYQTPLTRTATNAFGVEVQVVAGRLVAKNDRLVTGDATGTAIPNGGFVLSGHGRARDWLLSNYRDGVPVELKTVSNPTPTPPPASGVLPAWVVGGYWHQYQGPRVGQISPLYNIAWVAFAIGGGGANMSFRPYAQDEASFIAEIAASKRRGVLWCISLGGGVPKASATVLRTEADAVRCFETLVPIIDKFGFQGVDYDLENGPSGFTGEALLSLSLKLKAKYGPQFVISVVPRPYETFYFDIAARLHGAGVLDLLMFQFYDAPETRDATFLRAWIPRVLDQAQAKGVPYSKMVVGAITYTKYNLGWNTIETYRQVIESMRTTRGIRGAFVWEMSLDAKESWSFATQIRALAG